MWLESYINDGDDDSGLLSKKTGHQSRLDVKTYASLPNQHVAAPAIGSQRMNLSM